ncbi:MAG: hypothetical protein NVSMB42_02860 [Herpetosiphon sp.]
MMQMPTHLLDGLSASLDRPHRLFPEVRPGQESLTPRSNTGRFAIDSTAIVGSAIHTLRT